MTARVLGFAINKLVFHEHLLRVYFRLTLSDALVISKKNHSGCFRLVNCGNHINNVI